MENTDQKSVGRIETWPQWIAAIGVLILMIHMGCIDVWSSPYIEPLTSLGSPFLITLAEMSWVISVLNFGRPLGAISGTIITNYWGSKTGVLISCVPITLCWLFIILADNVNWLYVARFSGGISGGMSYACNSLYLAEIAEPSNRGMLLAMCMIGVPCGNILMTSLGAYLSMKESTEILLILGFAIIALFMWLPESPHHYVKYNEDDKARSSIHWYHRNYDVELELMKLHKFIEDHSEKSIKDTLRQMTTKQFRKSSIMIVILIMLTQTFGIGPIVFYMEMILTSAKVSVIEPSKIVIIVMVLGVPGSILSVFLMDKCGRKILMIVSCFGVVIAFTLLSLNFWSLSYGFDPKTVESLSIVGMILYNTAGFVGLIPIPPLIAGEIFPPHLKCIAMCIASCCAGLCAFIAASTYVPLLQIMPEHYLFLFYAVILLTTVPYTIFFVPETKGLSLQEIQDQLSGKNTLKSNTTWTEELNVNNISGHMISLDSVNTK
ncbi:facilitated trehalose transporter Tret1-like [Ceratina calcarata]|uniref:Facilitated trehalose transporter Tret1-like n=1 Tax=Ceratina calcarata TaxID=156304 RepID=A0AAJ7JAV2_9HYME|nr:facilitated trehalose transporter Tret1-like [Ceratina calcarata]